MSVISRSTALAALAVLASLNLVEAADTCAPPKVRLCHIPQGNAGNVQEICVGAASVPAHRQHGDYDPLSFWLDGDGDSFGAGAASTGCTVPAGWVRNDDDCDDSDAAVSPAAAEICVDGVDNNCNGTVDERVDVLLHCGPSSSVLETLCGLGHHVLQPSTAANISYVVLHGVSSVDLNHCDRAETWTVTGNTNLCSLPGGCCAEPERWNDSVCSLDLF